MSKKLSSWMVFAIVTAVLLSVHAGYTQEKKSDAKKPAAEAKGRLPNNYGRLGLSDEQRDKIYGIQGKYDRDIDKLEAQIADLKSKRDTEIAAILTPQQKTQLTEIMAASKKKDGDAKPKEEKKDEKK